MRTLKERIFRTSRNSNRILAVLNAADRTDDNTVMNISATQSTLGFRAGVNR